MIGYETGVTETVDPLAGSYFVESLTDELERLATAMIEKVDGMGGAVRAIEAGCYQDEIHDAAFRIQQGIESGQRVVVGVNRFVDAGERPLELQRIAEAGDRSADRPGAGAASRSGTRGPWMRRWPRSWRRPSAPATCCR